MANRGLDSLEKYYVREWLSGRPRPRWVTRRRSFWMVRARVRRKLGVDIAASPPIEYDYRLQLLKLWNAEPPKTPAAAPTGYGAEPHADQLPVAGR